MAGYGFPSREGTKGTAASHLINKTPDQEGGMGMRRSFRNSILIIAAFVGGCFTVGAVFTPPSPDSLHLGRTTANELVAMVGSAAPVTETTLKGKVVQCMDYDSFKAGLTSQGKGLLGRSASYCFTDGVLVGYVLTSNIESESTDFDAGKARSIKPGMTRADVIRLLGPPAGGAIYPICDVGNGSQLRYSYTGYTGSLSTKKTVVKDAYIELDASNVVVDVRVREKPV